MPSTYRTVIRAREARGSSIQAMPHGMSCFIAKTVTFTQVKVSPPRPRVTRILVTLLLRFLILSMSARAAFTSSSVTVRGGAAGRVGGPAVVGRGTLGALILVTFRSVRAVFGRGVRRTVRTRQTGIFRTVFART